MVPDGWSLDGLEVLHAGQLALPASLTSASLEVVLGFARGLYDTICADLASSLDPFTVQIMREARRIFMVMTPELVPLYLAADRLNIVLHSESMVSSPNAGVTNYYLPIFPSDVKETAPALILWFFDSRGGKHFLELDELGNEIPYPGYVDDLVSHLLHHSPSRNGSNDHVTVMAVLE